MQNLWVVTLICTLIACGGDRDDDITSSSPMRSRTLEVKAQRTGQPVAGALIQISDGRSFFTSPSGIAGIEDALNKSVTIFAPGFITRSGVTLTSPSQTEYLWEDDDQLPLQFTKELVYGFNQEGFTKRLTRPTIPLLTLQTDQAIMADPRMEQDLVEAIAAINAVLGQSRTGPTTRFLLDRVAPAPSVFITLNPDNQENPGALTWTYTAGAGAIIHCKIEFRDTIVFWGQHLQRALQHELTHCLGMIHTPSYPGIMGGSDRSSNLEFTWMEQQAMLNIFRRAPGNQMPDDASGLSTQLARNSYRMCSQATPSR